MNASNPSLRLLFLVVLLCLGIPAAVADPVVSISSGAAGTDGPPPQDVSVYANEAKAAVAEGNWTGALFVTTRGLAWYPDSADLLCLHGYTLRKLGQYDRAVDAVSKGILLDPKPVRYANRGYGYLALGNHSAALADAEVGIALDDTYSTIWGVKALALQGMGRNTEALAAIETAILLSPDNAHYRHVKGRILAANGDCAGARAALQKSLDLDSYYVLPWPGYLSAREDRDALDASCTPATAPFTTTPQAGVPALVATAAIAGAMIAGGMRK